MLQIKEILRQHRENACGFLFAAYLSVNANLTAYPLDQFTYRIVENSIVPDHLIYLLAGVHYGRVMLAAELPPDLRKAVFCQPLAQIHR